MKHTKRRELFWLAAVLVAMIGAVGYATLGLAAGTGPAGGLDLELILFASGLDEPVDITHAGDDRLFVVEQDGYIRIVTADGSVLPTPFLNIDGRVGSTGYEQGLLGLAFDPNYASNGYFYVNYTDNDPIVADTVVSRFSVTADPNVADPNSETILLQVDQPYSNHNGGDLAFGPDGYLYIPLGDGGAGGDPGDRAQNPGDLLGKILRLDVNGGGLAPDCDADGAYTIPADNPLINEKGACDEIWALGMRNPWRFGFDRETGDMFVGDVGQDSWEEVDFQPASSSGGENYGWRCYEGNHAYNLTGCDGSSAYVFPAAEYSSGGTNSQGCAVTGGYVYRGSRHPALFGTYLFADYCSGNFWSLEKACNQWELVLHGQLLPYPITPSVIGESLDGELYVGDRVGGRIFHLEENSIPPTTTVACSYFPAIYR